MSILNLNNKISKQLTSLFKNISTIEYVDKEIQNFSEEILQNIVTKYVVALNSVRC